MTRYSGLEKSKTQGAVHGKTEHKYTGAIYLSWIYLKSETRVYHKLLENQ